MGSKYSIQIAGRRLKILIVTMISILLVYNLSISADKRQVRIDNNFLRKHLPQLKNPRLMTVLDIKEQDEKEGYRDLGLSFVIEGDFNKDGYADYAVVGKYDGPYPDKSIFVAVLTVGANKIRVDFLHKFAVPHDRAFLCLEPGHKVSVENIDKRFDVIIVAMKLWTNYVWAVAWDGKKYIETQAEYIPEKEGRPLGNVDD